MNKQSKTNSYFINVLVELILGLITWAVVMLLHFNNILGIIPFIVLVTLCLWIVWSALMKALLLMTEIE